MNNKKKNLANNVLSPIDFAFSSGNYALVRSLALKLEKEPNMSQQQKLHIKKLFGRTQNDSVVFVVGLISIVVLVAAAFMTVN